MNNEEDFYELDDNFDTILEVLEENEQEYDQFISELTEYVSTIFGGYQTPRGDF